MRGILTVVGLTVALAGCGVSLQSPGEAEEAAKTVYEKIVANDLVGLEAMSTPDLKSQETQAVLDEMRAQIPKETATKDETTAWRVNANIGVPAQADIKRAYTYPSGVVLFDAVLQKKSGDATWRLAGVHVLRQPPGVGQ